MDRSRGCANAVEFLLRDAERTFAGASYGSRASCDASFSNRRTRRRKQGRVINYENEIELKALRLSTRRRVSDGMGIYR